MMKYIQNGKVQIYINEMTVNNSNIAILIIHGLAEHSGRYDDFIFKLNERGISVFAMDLRGHGQTISKKGDCESIKKVISDVDAVIDYIKNSYKFEKLGIFGHSIGGLVTSIYASINKKLDFLVLSSPAVYCPKKLKIIKLIPYKILSFIYLKKKHSESQEMLEYSKNDKFALKKFSLRTIGEFFVDGIQILKKKLDIKIPVLLVCGMQDRLLNEQEYFKDFMKRLIHAKNKLIAYENAKHRIVQNEGCEDRINDIIKWIEEAKDE